jgi:ANTAR domain-containing protein
VRVRGLCRVALQGGAVGPVCSSVRRLVFIAQGYTGVTVNACGAKGIDEVSEFGRGVDLSSRTVIDVAIGVLVGWRGCSTREAFEELAGAVRETGVGIGSIARALVELACGTDQSAPHSDVALRLWGDVVPRRSALVSASRN